MICLFNAVFKLSKSNVSVNSCVNQNVEMADQRKKLRMFEAAATFRQSGHHLMGFIYSTVLKVDKLISQKIDRRFGCDKVRAGF